MTLSGSLVAALVAPVAEIDGAAAHVAALHVAAVAEAARRRVIVAVVGDVIAAVAINRDPRAAMRPAVMIDLDRPRRRGLLQRRERHGRGRGREVERRERGAGG